MEKTYTLPNKYLIPQYLCFTAVESNSTIKLNYFPGRITDIKYSFNMIDWISYTRNQIITLQNINSKVYFRGNIIISSPELQFSMTGKIAASGNVNSLFISQNFDFLTQLDLPWCFAGLFKNCSSLITAPTLPATTLSSYCYRSMFEGCTNLIQAPELPATTLAFGCYYYMFGGCTNLTQAPELPATTLTEQCYYYMFYNCTSLTTAPALLATTLAKHCYMAMFSGCTLLTVISELPAIKVWDNCYQAMFSGCTSLVDAQITLPAIEVGWECYAYMFYNCTSLKYPPIIKAQVDDSTYSGCDFMFKNCSSLKISNTAGTPFITAPRSYYEMFKGTGGTYTSDPIRGNTYYWYE